MRTAYMLHTPHGAYIVKGVSHLGKIGATVTASRPFVTNSPQRFLLPYRDIASVEFINPHLKEDDLTETEVGLLRKLHYVEGD